jgi:hypothetical protein
MSNVVDIEPKRAAKANATALEALDALALALADHDHDWNERERQLFEQAIDALSRTGLGSSASA